MSINQLAEVTYETDKLKNDVLELNSNIQKTGAALLEKVCS